MREKESGGGSSSNSNSGRTTTAGQPQQDNRRTVATETHLLEWYRREFFPPERELRAEFALGGGHDTAITDLVNLRCAGDSKKNYHIVISAVLHRRLVGVRVVGVD